MKPMPKSPTDLAPLLVFGAHPDDIEFGCGGVVAVETQAGREAHLVVCSRGESATNGTPEERIIEAGKAASALGATLEFIDLDGDARLEIKASHALKLADVIRRVRPAILLAPSLVENQHPDHSRLGRLVRDAARLARYGGVTELLSSPPHHVRQLFFYAVTPDAEPRDATPVLVDISGPEVLQAWIASMEAHVTQARTRNYVELQIMRARLHGARANVSHACALYPNDPIVVESLAPVSRGARRF
jgi:LmbE family N-acetylglucosaminyl deacetylase